MMKVKVKTYLRLKTLERARSRPRWGWCWEAGSGQWPTLYLKSKHQLFIFLAQFVSMLCHWDFRKASLLARRLCVLSLVIVTCCRWSFPSIKLRTDTVWQDSMSSSSGNGFCSGKAWFLIVGAKKEEFHFLLHSLVTTFTFSCMQLSSLSLSFELTLTHGFLPKGILSNLAPPRTPRSFGRNKRAAWALFWLPVCE